MKTLLPFIDKVHKYFMKSSPDPEKELLYRHLKLSEEFGEQLPLYTIREQEYKYFEI